jgi:L-lactate dehydrogenase (cytochrome)
MPIITNVEDLRQLARRRIPRALFDYVDRGSYDEVTLRANRTDLDAIRLRQRILIDASNISLATTMLGEAVAMPVAIAPAGMTGLIRGDGEILSARAASTAGIRFCLSTMSIGTIEDVHAATSEPFWFQLYVFRDRGFTRSMIERARQARCSALFVTVDLPMRGQRHMDIKNGLSIPLRVTPRNVWDVITRPSWSLGVLGARRRNFGNIANYLQQAGMYRAGSWANDNFDRSLNWHDIEWIRAQWPGKLVLKGLLDADDASRAVSAGIDGIVVSNHGGRQLDGARSSIASLPAIVRAVGERLEILFDGGIRSGQDVLKALALGARGCLIGRAALYGLGALGESGVLRALDLIRAELTVSMALTGQCNVTEIRPDIVAS